MGFLSGLGSGAKMLGRGAQMAGGIINGDPSQTRSGLDGIRNNFQSMKSGSRAIQFGGNRNALKVRPQGPAGQPGPTAPDMAALGLR